MPIVWILKLLVWSPGFLTFYFLSISHLFVLHSGRVLYHFCCVFILCFNLSSTFQKAFYCSLNISFYNILFLFHECNILFCTSDDINSFYWYFPFLCIISITSVCFTLLVFISTFYAMSLSHESVTFACLLLIKKELKSYQSFDYMAVTYWSWIHYRVIGMGHLLHHSQ